MYGVGVGVGDECSNGRIIVIMAEWSQTIAGGGDCNSDVYIY